MLWASLAAFLIFFAVYTIPHISALHAQSEATSVLEMTSENEAFCAKLGMGTKASTHDRCIGAIQEFRAAAEKRINERF
jgi:hypothetical protein